MSWLGVFFSSVVDVSATGFVWDHLLVCLHNLPNIGHLDGRKSLLHLAAGDEQRCHPSCDLFHLEEKQFRHPHRRSKNIKKTMERCRCQNSSSWKGKEVYWFYWLVFGSHIYRKEVKIWVFVPSSKLENHWFDLSAAGYVQRQVTMGQCFEDVRLS